MKIFISWFFGVWLILVLVWGFGAHSVRKENDEGVFTDLWGRDFVDSPEALQFLFWSSDQWPGGFGGMIFDNVLWTSWVVLFALWVKKCS